MADYILCLSYGKDSFACLGAIKKLGLPLTRIVHAEVWATDTIPAALPPMVEFKAKADKIIKERWGIEVEHVWATNVDGVQKEKVTYEDVFYHELTRGKHIGMIKGFPMTLGQWCQKLKLNAIKNICSDDDVRYLGIAADEPLRIAKHKDRKNIVMPLVNIGWEEWFCKAWCYHRGLLSPIYTDSERDGCWFCHNQGIDQLRLLRKKYPEYWELLLKWDNDSSVTFRSDGYTVHDFDARFALEDAGLISPNDKWLWGYLNDTPIQLKIHI